ncbi:malic enzyme-like NAD(P)-binding protein [Methanosarcina sp. T3]|uniref:malic enzyme-like NAD(P)-binding protein n=1 Tax=Methanosarcina sp. T3 TaxID=3439062 RepID=UPI003F8421E6
MFLPEQANNFYIYPAVGLAVYIMRAKRATGEIFIEAAKKVCCSHLKAMFWRPKYAPPYKLPL